MTGGEDCWKTTMKTSMMFPSETNAISWSSLRVMHRSWVGHVLGGVRNCANMVGPGGAKWPLLHAQLELMLLLEMHSAVLRPLKRRGLGHGIGPTSLFLIPLKIPNQFGLRLLIILYTGNRCCTIFFFFCLFCNGILLQISQISFDFAIEFVFHLF